MAHRLRLPNLRPLLAALLFVGACSLSIGAMALLMFAPVQTIANGFKSGALMGVAVVLFILARILAGPFAEAKR